MYIILFMLIVVAVIVGVYLLVRKVFRRKPATRGAAAGAEKAAAAARNFARSNGFRFIAPAHLSAKGATADLDAIVVGYFGVLGLRAYGYNGEVYGSAGEKEWLQVSPREERTTFENPLTQASADVRVIRDVLFGQKLKQIPVEVLCVFTDAKVQLALPKDAGHYTLQSLKSQLSKEKYLEDKGFELEAVEKALRIAAKE